ncbi:MAG: hypothetical protein A2W25_12285 [candidate division Zixibacteria bacterium RBG_16_53_22]|nr:MAG: hypothetical protein A2W25_12285 [candidate division Zixibacteria bacterium RBG_16_53_22]
MSEDKDILNVIDDLLDVIHAFKPLLQDILEVLYNVPEAGETWDQQHADTHLMACQAIEEFLKEGK